MRKAIKAAKATPAPPPDTPAAPPARPVLDSIERNRLENLRMLVRYHDGPVSLSRKLGYQNAAFMVQLSSENYSRRITGKNARKMEVKLGLPEGIIDSDPGAGRIRAALGVDDSGHAAYSGTPFDASLEVSMQRNRMSRGRLSDVIRRVMELLGPERSTPDNVAHITDETLYVADLTDQEPHTLLIQRVISKAAK
ncbi:MAG: hypothetical protein ACOYB0_08425 [Polynucleobacter sp.]